MSNTASFAYNPDNLNVAGSYDAVAVIEHEISEALGRISYLGSENFEGNPLYSIMDLFRYTSPGVHDLDPTAGYFSVDGQHLLYEHNDPSNGGDARDWDPERG